MKKYDLYIVGLYTTIILIAFISIFCRYQNRIRYNEELTALFNTKINKVVINDFKDDMIIIQNNITDDKDWFIEGHISPNEIKSLKIKDNILYINYSSKYPAHLLKVFISNDVVVELNNSPYVKIHSSSTCPTNIGNLKKTKKQAK